MTIAALSGALTGPPAFAFQSDLEDSTTVELRLDAGMVLAAGSSRIDDPALLFDIDAGLDVEALTDSGRRWGFVLGGRVEQDSGRRAWGGLAGNCPAGTGDCASVSENALALPVESPVSGFYTSGPAQDDDLRAALQDAHLFVHTGWGEWRVGYGAGAGQLDAAAGPTAFRLSRADNGRVDLTGLSGARTWNYASGWSPKLVFRSIQLGQVSTVGLFRVSASYTPSVRDCGVDACAREYGAAGRVSPVSDSVLELAGRYDVRRGEHDFAVSFSVSRGDDATGRPEFAGIETQTLGLSWQSGAWRAGVRLLDSNSGAAADAGYSARSVSLGYEMGDWLTTLEWAGFSDDLAHVDGSNWQISASKLVGEHWVIGGGLQSGQRQNPVILQTGRRQIEDEAMAAFIELGWRF